MFSKLKSFRNKTKSSTPFNIFSKPKHNLKQDGFPLTAKQGSHVYMYICKYHHTIICFLHYHHCKLETSSSSTQSSSSRVTTIIMLTATERNPVSSLTQNTPSMQLQYYVTLAIGSCTVCREFWAVLSFHQTVLELVLNSF